MGDRWNQALVNNNNNVCLLGIYTCPDFKYIILLNPNHRPTKQEL